MTAKKKKDGGQRNPIMPRPSYMWIYVLVAAFIIGYSLYGAENTEPVRSDWNTVEGMVRSGDVERIEVVNRDVAEVFLKKDAVEKYRTDSTQPQFKRLPDEGVQLVFNIGSVDAFREDLKAAEQQSGQSVPVRYENKENGWMNLLVNFLPWVLIIGVWFFIMRGMSRGGGAAGGGLMNVGKAKAQVYDKDAPKRVTFKDVAGLEEAKVEVMEIVDFLRKPEKYRDLGAKIPKGDFGFGLRGDVRRRGCFARARSVRAGQAEGALHRLHRRDRRDRSRPRQECRIFGQRRAGEHAQPAAYRDGRLPNQFGRDRAGGHQPRRYSGQGAHACRPFRPPDRRRPARRARTGRDFRRSHA